MYRDRSVSGIDGLEKKIYDITIYVLKRERKLW